jgi:putative ABC transport system ATP-binding protein
VWPSSARFVGKPDRTLVLPPWNRPAILLADEPTGNPTVCLRSFVRSALERSRRSFPSILTVPDSQNSKAVLRLMVDLNQRLGQTILMITHDQEAASYAGRSIHMRDGQIL